MDGLGTISPENSSGAAEKTNHTDNLGAGIRRQAPVVRRREGK